MTGSPSGARAKRRDRKPDNRRALVVAAVNADDQGVALLLAAIDYWRATCKRAAPEDRAEHRQRLADLIVSDADEWVDTSSSPINFTRLEAVA
jgi:acyl-CoA reductase-like NAD-dependent aldehyde dehydrogenase